MTDYTKVPNWIFEVLMPIAGNAEFKVSLFVARKTHGWHKDSDRISISQFMDGTGLSRPSVRNGIKDAIERGAIVREKIGNIYSYKMGNLLTPLEDPGGKDTYPQRGNLLTPLPPRKGKDTYPTKESNIKKEKERPTNAKTVVNRTIPADDHRSFISQLNFKAEYTRLGYSPKEAVAITNTLLDATGKTKLADQPTQAGEKALTNAQDFTLTLMGMYEGKLTPIQIQSTVEYIKESEGWAAKSLGYGHIAKYINDSDKTKKPATKPISIPDLIERQQADLPDYMQ